MRIDGTPFKRVEVKSQMRGHEGRRAGISMREKVLVYSRFPKALMQRIGERFELLDAAGKPPQDVFPAEELKGVRAMITAGGTPLGGEMMDKLPSLRAIVCYGTGYDGVDLAAAANAQDRRRPQSRRQCSVGCRHRRHLDAGRNAAIARRGQLCAQRRLGRGQAVADDASAGRHARPQDRRLRHGRDRPQDRGARRGVRVRGRLFQPQPARRALSVFFEVSSRWRTGAAC